MLAGTFAALATLPVTFLAELGFAVAFGVLLDTIVVRSVLVTALNLDLGRWVWWPSRLARQPAPEQEITSEPAGGGLLTRPARCLFMIVASFGHIARRFLATIMKRVTQAC